MSAVDLDGPDASVERIPLIDSDAHTTLYATAPELRQHLSKRWQDHLDAVGYRAMSLTGERPRQKPYACRGDAIPPSGALPGMDPGFVRQQHLDGLDLSGAVMNDLLPYTAAGIRPMPDAMAVDLVHAMNCVRQEMWFDHDPRWYGSIAVPHEVSGAAAAEEIRRCKEEMGYGDRWVQVLLPPDNERPAGNEKYWPIYEAAEHYGIPVGFHVLAQRRLTGTGTPNYYLEEHTDFAGFNFFSVSSLIFEGVFERFPKLKIAFLELAWSWAVPFAWRLDEAHRLLQVEVGHLPRKPSEYLAEHFWFSTQPMEEPENLGWFDDVYQLFEDAVGHKLMYSSDYPHWDFDLPEAVPATLPVETRRKILGETAADLYGIPLRPGTGTRVQLASARP